MSRTLCRKDPSRKENYNASPEAPATVFLIVHLRPPPTPERLPKKEETTNCPKIRRISIALRLCEPKLKSAPQGRTMAVVAHRPGNDPELHES